MADPQLIDDFNEDDDDPLACLIGHMDEEDAIEENDYEKSNSYCHDSKTNFVPNTTFLGKKNNKLSQSNSTFLPRAVLKESVKVPQRVLSGPRRLRHPSLKYFK